MATCNCMGPQNGEPLCPCRMRAVRQHEGARQKPMFAIGGPDLEARRRAFDKNQKSLRDICEEIEQRDADQRGISTYDEAKHT